MKKGFQITDLGMTGLGCYLVGLLLWFPDVALVNIGAGTSIQPVVVMSGIVVTLMLYSGAVRFSRYFVFWFALLLFLVLLQIWQITPGTGDHTFYLKGTTAFTLSLFMILVGYLVAREKDFARLFFRGYIAGGVISGCWSAAQWVAWRFLGHDFPLLVGLHNSASFAKYAANENYVGFGRGFAFTPEPSILFVLLVPCLVLMLYQRRAAFPVLLVVLGIISTSSMGIFFVLPFSLLYFLFASGRLGRKTSVLLVALFLTGISIFVIVAVNSIDINNASYETNILGRLANISTSASFISRTNSLITAYDMFLKKPFFGWGVQSREETTALSEQSTTIEENIGINSFLMSMLVWFGLILTVVFLYPSAKLLFLKRYELVSIKLFVIITLFGSFLSVSYFNLYNIWLALGMAAQCMDPPPSRTFCSSELLSV